MIEEMGWEAFNRTPYDSLKGRAKTGSSCSDCHDPETMALRITRPAFRIAMEAAGVDLKKATRQEMRDLGLRPMPRRVLLQGRGQGAHLPVERGALDRFHRGPL